MKNIKYIVAIIIVSLFTSCNDDENKTEYPGNIIIHGDITNMKFEETNQNTLARIHAFSGGSTNDLSLLNGEDWTYELWIKVNRKALIGDKTIANGKDAGGACISERENNFELYLVNDSDADYAIKYNSLDGSNEVEASMVSDESTVNLSFGQWVHVAISRSSTDGIAKFYINGILIDSSNDPIWQQLPDNDKKLNFNCMARNATYINFFRGGMNNYRISTIDRYPNEFTPNYDLNYGQEVDAEGDGVFETDAIGRDVAVVNIDEYTLLQLNLNNILTDFPEGNSNSENYKKLKILGVYSYYIKIHNSYFSWEKNIEDEYPVTGY